MVLCQYVFPDSKIPPGPVKAKKKRWTNSRALICPIVWVAHGRGPYVRITNFRRLFVWVKHIRRPIVLMTCNTCQGSVCPGDTCQDSVCLGDTCFFYSGAIPFLLLLSMSHAILLLLSSLPNTISCKKDIIRGVRYISICMTRMFLLTEF